MEDGNKFQIWSTVRRCRHAIEITIGTAREVIAAETHIAAIIEIIFHSIRATVDVAMLLRPPSEQPAKK